MLLWISLFVLSVSLPLRGAEAQDQVVVVTDSHGVGAFGETLAALLSKRSNTEFSLFASGGSMPRHWVKGGFKSTRVWSVDSGILAVAPEKLENPRFRTDVNPNLASLWAKQSPMPESRRISILVQGTNLHHLRTFYTESIRETEALIKTANEHSDLCIWVGPPNMAKEPAYGAAAVAERVNVIQVAIRNQIQKGNRGCEWIDSRELSQFPPITKSHPDQVHYHWMGQRFDLAGREAATQWAEGVWAKIEAILSHPDTQKSAQNVDSAAATDVDPDLKLR